MYNNTHEKCLHYRRAQRLRKNNKIRGDIMTKRMTILDKAEIAMKEAVRKVVAQHKKDGRPLVVWENGRVKKVAAK